MNEHEAIAEIQQARSRYQLEHFVVGQHDTAEMRFYQVCIELQDMEHKLARATLDLRKGEVAIERLRASGDAIDAIDADIQELDLEVVQLSMIGAEREVTCLREMFEDSPKFTRKQIERAQPEYWRARLTRQYELQRISGAVGWAQLDAMRQTGMLTEIEQAGGPSDPQLPAA